MLYSEAILASCRCIKVRNIIILGKKKTELKEQYHHLCDHIWNM